MFRYKKGEEKNLGYSEIKHKRWTINKAKASIFFDLTEFISTKKGILDFNKQSNLNGN